MWTFDEQEHAYFERVVGNINSQYKNYNVTSNTINIDLDDNLTASEALKSFSNWYKIVYGDSISYAQISAVLVVDSKSIDTFNDLLLKHGIVPSSIEGPIQDSLNNTNASMLTNIEFILVCGGVGIVVAVMGIYVDSVIPAYRRLRKLFKRNKK